MSTTNPRQVRDPRETIHTSAIVTIVANLDEQLHELSRENADLKMRLKEMAAALEVASAKPQFSTARERQPPDDQAYLSARQVRRRYGDVSHMWIERRLEDDPPLPKPTLFGRQRYWAIDELIAWERARAARPEVA